MARAGFVMQEGNVDAYPFAFMDDKLELQGKGVYEGVYKRIEGANYKITGKMHPITTNEKSCLIVVRQLFYYSF